MIKIKRTNQFERTDRDITNAFLQLLSVKPFEKITIQDIITEAMVNRSTFYQHFPDKYAVLEKLQQKYMDELMSVVTEVFSHNRTTLNQIDRIIETFFLKNRYALRLLLNIKTEHVDITQKFRCLFMDYFQRSFEQITNLEAYLISGLLVDFFIYYLNHDELNGSYSTLLYESYYKMSLFFFNMDKKTDAQEALHQLLNTYAWENS